MATFRGENTRMFGNAKMFDSTVMRDNTVMYDNAVMYGNAQMHSNAVMYGNAQMHDNAVMYGRAQMCGDGELRSTGDYLLLGPVGSENRFITLHRDRGIGIRIVAGCWNGPLTEFLARLDDSSDHQPYARLVPMLHRELAARMTPVEINGKTWRADDGNV